MKTKTVFAEIQKNFYQMSLTLQEAIKEAKSTEDLEKLSGVLKQLSEDFINFNSKLSKFQIFDLIHAHNVFLNLANITDKESDRYRELYEELIQTLKVDD